MLKELNAYKKSHNAGTDCQCRHVVTVQAIHMYSLSTCLPFSKITAWANQQCKYQTTVKRQQASCPI